ncbi:response regulator [Tumebacillus amylolyticus]|nr:response regulator [Tumebacillus amylolyticus]
MIVENELLALLHMQQALEEYEGIRVVGAFQNPVQALKQFADLQPDVVFLEIHLPEVSGFEAVERMRSLCPDTEIVFVTTDDRHALQAFEWNAVDYLLKPVLQPRLEKTVRRLLSLRGKQVQHTHSSEGTTRVLCFHSLRFQPVGMPPQVPKWRTSKAQELFAYLLHRRGELVRKGTLMEVLWPELDEKRAMTQLYSTVYQIRKGLGKMEIDIQIKNSSIQEGYVLDASRVSIDTEEWERSLKQLSGSRFDMSEKLGQLLAFYEGDYLHDHMYVWAENERERLRKLWVQHARMLARHYIEADGRQAEAAELYERIQAVDPYDAEEGLTLLKLYDENGRTHKVKDCYHRITNAYTQELGLELPAPLVTWYAQWIHRQKENHLAP